MKTIEIERRFHLITCPDFSTEIIFINQYYNILNNGDIERYRTSRKNFHYNHTFEKIIKKNLSKGINEEIFFEISEKEFYEKTQGLNNLPSISKKRYIYHANGFKFEIDKFNGMDLVICEVELPSIDTEIIFPDFIKELIIKEITGEKEYSNYNLARKVF